MNVHGFEGLTEEQMATLYAEFAEEDRQLAEEGIADYQTGLAIEAVVGGAPG